MKNRMKEICMGALLAAMLAALPARAAEADGEPESEEGRPLVQIAILLDTSGSMSGLIEQAKRELWAIVNEFITARKGGQRSDLRVALYEYGHSPLGAECGYIRRIVPLTTDLDRVSEELFALRTNGGQEYCGMVIQRATGELAWSGSAEDLKVVFIAGNEPFTQGPVDYREACKAAVAKGIIVNTIHCGGDAEGVRGMWKDGAALADGTYSIIDQNRRIAHVAAPQDARIAELGVKLNETYVPYGAHGAEGAARQDAQDANARAASPGVNVSRMVAKANHHYRNRDWDLVDAVAEGAVKIEDLEDEDLPENMRKMGVKERRAFVETNAAARRRIQEEINELNRARQAHVAAEMKKLAAAGEETLGAAVREAARAQAEAKAFQF